MKPADISAAVDAGRLNKRSDARSARTSLQLGDWAAAAEGPELGDIQKHAPPFYCQDEGRSQRLWRRMRKVLAFTALAVAGSFELTVAIVAIVRLVTAAEF